MAQCGGLPLTTSCDWIRDNRPDADPTRCRFLHRANAIVTSAIDDGLGQVAGYALSLMEVAQTPQDYKHAEWHYNRLKPHSPPSRIAPSR